MPLSRLLSSTGVLLLCLAPTGCFRPNRDAPVELDMTWHGYLGNARHSAFEDERVPEREPTPRWRKGAGRGLTAAPILSGDAILAVTTNRMVMALSVESGSVYWEHRKNGPLSAHPVVHDEHLYVATSDVRGKVYKLRSRDGRQQWDKRIPGSSQPMMIREDRLYLAGDAGTLFALRLENGDRVWTSYVGRPVTPPLWVGDRILVGTKSDSLVAVNPGDGEIIGRTGLPDEVSAPPVFDENTVYLPIRNGEVLAVDAVTLDVRWRVQLPGPVLAPPALAADGQLFLTDRTGTVWAVSPEGEPRRLASLGSAATRSMTLTSNAVLVGLLDGTFAAVARSDGAILWSMKLGDSITEPALVRNGVIFVPLRRGRIVRLQ